MFGRRRSARLRFVCSDMWRPYLRVIAKKAARAVHILDRYHVVARLNRAVDQVRAAEVKRMKREGYEPVLKRTRWCFLKRPENLTEQQRTTLDDLMRYDLKSVRAYLLKESFQALWEYTSPVWADRYFARLAGAGHAQLVGAHQANGPHHSQAPRVDPQLVQGQEAVLQRHCRGLELPHQTDLQKSLRLSHARCRGNCPVSHAGRTSPTKTRPKILLKRQFYWYW